MQKCTVTIVVESEKPKFSPSNDEIYMKAKMALEAGNYTADIEDINPTN